jgi:hypothetical protein
MEDKTTIQILKTTRELIAKHGIYRESYDDTIKRIFNSVDSAACGEFHDRVVRSKGRVALPSNIPSGTIIEWRIKKG